MDVRKTLLIIDDEIDDRKSLKDLLSDEYIVIGYSNISEGLQYIKTHCREVSIVLLRLNMPNMSGYEFLKTINGNADWRCIPVVIITGSEDKEKEKVALELGAWDYIKQPFDVGIIKVRLKNLIYRSQLSAFNELKYLAEYDSLTGMYNKTKFYQVTKQMLSHNTGKRFVFIRLDIDRFQLVNTFFGMDEGDHLLKYTGDEILKIYSKVPYCTFGRIESDIFGICHPYDESSILRKITEIRTMLSKYNQEYDIVPTLGLYVIEDNNLPVETIFNRATLASKNSKGNYVKFYSFYNEKMSSLLIKEQEITNEMKTALEKEEFDIYFQPKYSLQSNQPCGAEALVRWFHPTKGMVMPSDFIPVFEKNGFITKLDYYVWDRACKYLRKWMDEGKTLFPISVNISRVNMYNPKIVDIIIGIVEKYNIPASLLNLELTESAYTDNPIAMKEIIRKLQEYGFLIMMDDFGSGYSSLNILKEISVDVLKVDMRFLSDTDIPGRGDNILASVIRMAKWLKLPVIVEGVETAEQCRFLKSIGCDFVQGFYFASPMPVDQYLQLVDKKKLIENEVAVNERINIDSLFESNPQMEILFGSYLQAIGIYEFADNNIELLRVNEGFYDLFGNDDIAIKSDHPISVVDEEYRDVLVDAFKKAIKTKQISEVEYLRKKMDGEEIWIKLRLQYIQIVGTKYLLFGTLSNITSQKKLDEIVQKYRKTIEQKNIGEKIMLVVDDYKVNRLMLRSMFADEYEILEAEDGNNALEVLKKNKNISIIILDLIMPNMDGKELLRIIKKDNDLNQIPIIVVTSDDSPQSQIDLISLGANDYIIKPFVTEIVLKRVHNVMNAENSKKELEAKNEIANELSELLR